MKLTEEQTKQLIGILLTALVVVIVQVAGVFGINAVMPAPVHAPGGMAPTASGDKSPISTGGGVNAESLGGGIRCDSGSTACVISVYGRNLLAYSDGGTASNLRWSVTGTSGTVRHSGFDIINPSTAITVTSGGIITPTASYQPLTAAGSVGATIATSGIVTGTVVTFVNTVAQTITITDTGSIHLAGNAVLGQYDTLRVLWDGSSWNELGRSDN